MVLNEYERRTLHELERRIMAEDPRFPRSFDARAQRLDRARIRTSTVVAISAAVGLCSLMLAAGSPGGALAFLVAIWMVWCAWHNSRHRGGRRNGPS